MLYDLNIVWTPQTSPSELERTLKFSQSLGYNVVALSHTLEAPIPAQIINPIPQVGPRHPSFTTASSNSSSNTNTNNRSPLPITLRRATVLISDPASTNYRLPTLAAAFDLLAARPTTDKAFSAACTTMSEISLISLDLSISHPFRFKPKPCMAAVHRGVLFEVCYSQLVANNNSSNSNDAATAARQRGTFIANVLELVRATKGRGIVLSSEARAAAAGVGLRAPPDVVNLFACWGLGPEKGMEAFGVNPRAVVVNDGLRRRGFRGVVDIIQHAEGKAPPPAAALDHKEEGEGDGEDGVQSKVGGKKGGNNNIHQKQKSKDGHNLPPGGHQASSHSSANATGKRKHEGGGSDHGGGDQTSLPVLSKRQAKKLKLAEQKATATATTTTGPDTAIAK